MKTFSIVLLLVTSVMNSCNRLDIEKGTPTCIEDKIKGFNKSSHCGDASVKEYPFREIRFMLLVPELAVPI